MAYPQHENEDAEARATRRSQSPPCSRWRCFATDGGGMTLRPSCPHKAGTAPRLGADGKAADLGKHENGNAELRPEVKALTLLSWKGTATSLTGLRHHGWPG